MGRNEIDRRRWTKAFFVDDDFFTLPEADETARHIPMRITSDWGAVCGKT